MDLFIIYSIDRRQWFYFHTITVKQSGYKHGIHISIKKLQLTDTSMCLKTVSKSFGAMTELRDAMNFYNTDRRP